MATKSSKPTESAKKTGVKTPSTAVKQKKTIATKANAPKASSKASTSPVATRKKRAVNATLSKSTAHISLDPKPVAVEPIIPHDEIALRAYFIGERRQKLHWPGNPGTDWADAVKQLRAEALEKPLKKR